MASCDNDRECETVKPEKITPKKLPEQSGGGVEVVSTLPSVENAEKGIIYVYFTDLTDVSTFSGAYVLNEEAEQLVNISGSGGGGEGHIYTFEATTTGFKVSQDGTQIFEYTPVGYTLPKATSSTLGGVEIGDNVDVDNDGKISIPTATDLKFGVVKIDNSITESSTNPVTSAAIYAVIGNVESALAQINGD